MRGNTMVVEHRAMWRTPRNAANAVIEHPMLPPGDDDRFVGIAVMGPPFASGHYLAMRHFPATSFAPGYRSVWHRDPAGVWTFYATTPAGQSCARHFSSATPNDPVQCDIDVVWLADWSLQVRIAGLLDWRVDMRATPSTWVMSAIGGRLPAQVWTNGALLAAMGWVAGPMLGVGQLRLVGTAPNGHRFLLAPSRVWAVSRSHATLNGADLGPSGPLDRQARLAGFRLPQRGIYAVGHGHFRSLVPPSGCNG